MATKRDEQIAWKRLKKEFPNDYTTLELEYKQYGNKKEQVMYHAYVDLGTKNYLGDEFNTPKEAIDYLLRKVGRL